MSLLRCYQGIADIKGTPIYEHTALSRESKVRRICPLSQKRYRSQGIDRLSEQPSKTMATNVPLQMRPYSRLVTPASRQELRALCYNVADLDSR
jgi:hypothetical protein